MKRGRRSIREEVKSQILDVLSNTKLPLTTSSIRMLILKKFNKNLSWNTVQKYLNELVKSNQLSTIHLPHSKEKKKTGITVYILKR
jgi:predicted oxidoreductase (fatty acid repression mutant protein)